MKFWSYPGPLAICMSLSLMCRPIAIGAGIVERQAWRRAIMRHCQPDFLVEAGDAAMNRVSGAGVGVEMVGGPFQGELGGFDVVRITPDHRADMAVGGNQITGKGIE